MPPKHSSHDDAHHRVIETLRLFSSICRKLPQNEEKSENQPRRIDLHAAKIIKEEKKEVNIGKQLLGEVPGIEVGDCYCWHSPPLPDWYRFNEAQRNIGCK
ncbi:histone-lysine N-methyltransferase, H3 lysine-9 specific SUVH6-like [Olea europaea subsp. europaea]|uniref:Histone-lysine N-methyltransferase, H3 lysine-9 specific SUVH6-like n=1 Tax=Olea europaea subsp. europaea TaxID=158383 RepID=A0A8S0SZ22_OLEEU|nr:histone-lysine N-methyltransferase, H3 lysine-9 specific SUVH6-like [Olea europaea subsp. europaea]